MSIKLSALTIGFAAALALGACGETKAERGISGAALGAAGGAAIGAIAGKPGLGAAAGAGAGAIAGVATAPKRDRNYDNDGHCDRDSGHYDRGRYVYDDDDCYDRR